MADNASFVRLEFWMTKLSLSNPQLMKEREEKTRLVYAKFGIKYVA